MKERSRLGLLEGLDGARLLECTYGCGAGARLTDLSWRNVLASTLSCGARLTQVVMLRCPLAIDVVTR